MIHRIKSSWAAVTAVTWVGCSAPSASESGNSPSPDAGDGALESTAPVNTAEVTGDQNGITREQERGSCADFNPLGNVYWGELHLHTSYSLDSYVVGNRNTPEDAYAFALGGELPIGDSGQSLKIDRPLDFVAVTDHSEFFAITGECLLAESDSRYCQNFRDQGSPAQTALLATDFAQLITEDPRPLSLCAGPRGDAQCLVATRDAWQRNQQAAEAAYQECSFTTLLGYEWTAMPNGANLHRNVIFSGSNVPDVPLDYLQYPTAVSMWEALDEQCQAAEGCRAITIPHNSNASAGLMWETKDDPAAVPYMQRYQRLVELFQHKGNSECWPGESTSDDECDFEIVAGGVGGTGRQPSAEETAPGYIRSGLIDGLQAVFGGAENPLALGFVAATDTHNGTPGATPESNFKGHLASTDDTPAKRLGDPSNLNPGGITGVWAKENTRAAIFDALESRATFATSGPRIVLRMFAVGGLTDAEAVELCADPDFPDDLVDRGAVMMGGEYTSPGPPHVFVSALKDVTELEKIDIVRLTIDATGKVVTSVQPFLLEAPADKSSACVSYRDPAFAAGQPALYYARAFEVPTFRWSHYDCQVEPRACENQDLDVKIRERAWSSPIFYPGFD